MCRALSRSPPWMIRFVLPSEVFVARGGTAELTSTILTADEVGDLVERMLNSSGRRVDLSSPFVDATLPDCSRAARGDP
jgi:pilus assembly protein CpaF